MKLEVGMYVRTDGRIFKLDENNIDGWKVVLDMYKNAKVKASHNIIDLIEEGDYVNGSLVEEVGKDRVFTNVYYEDGDYNSFIGADGDWESCYVSDYRQEIICDYEIKSIVTKEQFSSMEYKVGE